MPTSRLHQAAGRFARFAAPTTRSLALVAASMILTACDNSGSLFPPSLGGSSPPPTVAPSSATDNYGPSISGKPQSMATVNVPYSFRPEAYDPDGDVMSFQVSGLPPWATFNAATGEISGVPPSGWSGSSGDIRISVSDGALKTALPAFSITVSNAGTDSEPTGSASLSWTAPTQNDDGSALTNLLGYRIYYGASASGLNEIQEIGDPNATNAVVSNLGAGTWYFSMVAINSTGTESSRTGIVSRTL